MDRVSILNNHLDELERSSPSWVKPYAAASLAPPHAPRTDEVPHLYRPSPAKLVVAHRGASGKHPEHSAEAYHEAVRAGADAIEFDFCSTSDGKLVIRHDIILEDSTNVEDMPEFADRKATYHVNSIDGDFRHATGWFAKDFTLEEIKTIRCNQAINTSLSLTPRMVGLNRKMSLMSTQNLTGNGR